MNKIKGIKLNITILTHSYKVQVILRLKILVNWIKFETSLY